MTRVQRKVFDFIASFIEGKGYSPSYQEIGNACGQKSLGTVCKHVKNLEHDGYLFRAGINKGRCLSITGKGKKEIKRARESEVETLRKRVSELEELIARHVCMAQENSCQPQP